MPGQNRSALKTLRLELLELGPYLVSTPTVPCHHIRLNKVQETVGRLYRTGTQQVLEEALGSWLTATIKKLQREGTEPRTGRFETQPRSARERKPL